jgi:hypothetical protein
VVTRTRELNRATTVMENWFFAWRESEEGERNGGSSSAPWRLEGHLGLTVGAAASVRPPWHAHIAALAYGRSATESN